MVIKEGPSSWLALLWYITNDHHSPQNSALPLTTTSEGEGEDGASKIY